MTTPCSAKTAGCRHITKGLGAGGDPSTDADAEAGRDMIKRIVTGADLVFIASDSEEVLELESSNRC